MTVYHPFLTHYVEMPYDFPKFVVFVVNSVFWIALKKRDSVGVFVRESEQTSRGCANKSRGKVHLHIKFPWHEPTSYGQKIMRKVATTENSMTCSGYA